MTLKYTPAPRQIGQKAVRGLREFSIPTFGAGTSGIQYNVTWTDTYFFDVCINNGTTQGQLLSNIHANLNGDAPKNGVLTGNVGARMYYPSAASALTDNANGEQIEITQADTADNMQIPTFGCTKLCWSMQVFSNSVTDNFSLELRRAINPSETVNTANAYFLVDIIDMNKSLPNPVASTMNCANFSSPIPYDIPVGSNFYLALVNKSSGASTNTVLGSIWLLA